MNDIFQKSDLLIYKRLSGIDVSKEWELLKEEVDMFIRDQKAQLNNLEAIFQCALLYF